ncbi:MAG: lysophospholipid acyltransferase family protein [Proteobacteria bacterium]|nr:lysophospholipid acyltransferase family protein [Pseudomonadota bacterium]
MAAVERLVGRIPPDGARALGAVCGRFAARLPLGPVRVARINLELAFPDWEPDRRAHLLSDSLANAGRVAAEIALMEGRHREALLAGVRFEGREHLEAARRESPVGGAIVLAAHFGSWELCGAAVARDLPLSVVYNELSNPVLAERVNALRARSGMQVLARGSAARNALRALAEGRFVVMLADQNARRREGVFAPLFAVPACTRDGPMRIAMRTGAPVVPVFFFREGASGRHVVRATPALELVRPAPDAPRAERDAAVLENVRRMNATFETAIRQAPDHWMWTHRRFRTRPPGEGRIYPSRRRRLR